MQPLSWFFAQLFPSISSASTEQYQICAKNYPQTHQVRWNLPRMIIWNQWRYWQNFLLLALFLRLMRKYNESCCVNTTGNSQRTSWTTEIDQTLLQRWFFEEYWQRTLLHYTWWGKTWRYETIMSRVHFTSKGGNIPCERVDSWKHEDRPNPGCEGLLSSRTLQCWDHDLIFIARPNSFLGSYRKRNQ